MSHQIKKIACVSIIFIICLLSACGFHLQGKTKVPPSLHTLYLESSSPYDNFTQQLRRNLQISNVKLVDMPDKAPVTLNIISTNQTTHQITNASSEQTRVYALTYTVTFSLNRPAGAILLGPFTASTSRTFSLAGGSLLNNTNEASAIAQDLQAALIEQMMARLSSADTLNALNQYFSPAKDAKHETQT